MYTYALGNDISKQKKVFSSQMSSEKFKDQKSKGKRDLQGFFKSLLIHRCEYEVIK